MKDEKKNIFNRRTFFGGLGLSLLAVRTFGGGVSFAGSFEKDAPAGHGMLLFGEKSVYLSHLPMFGKLNDNKTGYDSPHRYQVILEVIFKDKKGKELQELYTADRKKNPGTKIYTVDPNERFVLPEISPKETPENTRRTFPADVFRGHFERPGKEIISGLQAVTIEVERIIYFRQFDPREQRPKHLEYILFGHPEEMFLAHYISHPDNFDQIISVKTDRTFSAGELQKGIRLNIPGRKDTAVQRLKEKQKATAKLGKGSKSKGFQITAVREFYFEEGELLKDPIFDSSTEEEKRSGF
jgi:hypothetical protein